MATPIWKGSITFGLVSIPVRLYAAARPRRIALHQLHNKCHTRLKQPLFCPTCNRFVERSEVVKGFEYEKGQYVLIEPDEIKKITPAKLAEQLVQSLVADFSPKEYRDEFQERLNALIEAKLKGRSIAAPPEAPRAPVIDIMQALKKSLAASNKKKEEARPEMSRPAPAAVARRQLRKAG